MLCYPGLIHYHRHSCLGFASKCKKIVWVVCITIKNTKPLVGLCQDESLPPVAFFFLVQRCTSFCCNPDLCAYAKYIKHIQHGNSKNTEKK